jgi:hypothetical protein
VIGHKRRWTCGSRVDLVGIIGRMLGGYLFLFVVLVPLLVADVTVGSVI